MKSSEIDLNKTDEELVLMAQNGGETACEFILDKYKPLVRSVIRPFFLVGADREDILQEGMIGLYKAICAYSQSKEISFKAFAEVCIKRHVISAVKMASRKKHGPLNKYIPFENSEDDLVYDSDLTIDPEELVIISESNDIFKEKITALLSPFEIKVLNSFLEGKSYRQISTSLGKDVKSVNNALQRIKKKLRNQLN